MWLKSTYKYKKRGTQRKTSKVEKEAKGETPVQLVAGQYSDSPDEAYCSLALTTTSCQGHPRTCSVTIPLPLHLLLLLPTPTPSSSSSSLPLLLLLSLSSSSYPPLPPPSPFARRVHSNNCFKDAGSLSKSRLLSVCNFSATDVW